LPNLVLAACGRTEGGAVAVGGYLIGRRRSRRSVSVDVDHGLGTVARGVPVGVPISSCFDIRADRPLHRLDIGTPEGQLVGVPRAVECPGCRRTVRVPVPRGPLFLAERAGLVAVGALGMANTAAGVYVAGCPSTTTGRAGNEPFAADR